jgi:hypothetical protein
LESPEDAHSLGKLYLDNSDDIDEKMRYPICTGGRQAAPLEDSGGIHGYYAHLEAFADPDSEMHDETVKWLGKDFTPKAFDVDTINKKRERISSSPACGNSL